MMGASIREPCHELSHGSMGMRRGHWEQVYGCRSGVEKAKREREKQVRKGDTGGSVASSDTGLVSPQLQLPSRATPKGTSFELLNK